MGRDQMPNKDTETMLFVIPSPQHLRTSPALMARVTGTLFLAGVVLVLLSLALPHPAAADRAGMLGVAFAGSVGGMSLVLGARHARTWMIQAALVTGTILVCLCVYFSGVATGIYATMFIWVVLVSTFFFSAWIAASHLAFVLAMYAVTLALVRAPEFSSVTRWILTAVALSVSCAVMSWLVHGLRAGARRSDKLRADAESLARTDELTDLPNRRWLQDELDRELARAQRHATAVWAAMLDLDNFKGFNDRFGHGTADALLRDAAAQWRSALRTSDFLARYGGDEFVVLLPDCSLEDASQVMARLRRSTPLAQTCSAGMACWDGEASAAELLQRADAALYRAKAAGRGCAAVDTGAGAPSVLP